MKLLKIGFSIALLAALAYWQLFSAVDGDETISILFEVQGGQNFQDAATALEEKGIIRSDRALVLIAKIRGLEKALQPGRYKLSKSMDVSEVLDAITNPEKTTTSVTIPEGFTVRDIDKRLTEQGLIFEGEFTSKAMSLEGYLFPDTYFVYTTNFQAEDLIKKMQDNFLAKITPDLEDAVKKSNKTLPEIIIMASILEKEVRTDKDYPVVAGILWKRIAHDWPLQADATLLYGRETPIITKRELGEDSPYNTYKNKGLPPTPISNPGLKAIRAAIFPEESQYWFYLTDSEGTVHYAKTNEEQNENRKKYL